MGVSRSDVLAVADLARLRLSDEEVERYTEQLDRILGHIEALNEVDLEDAEAAAAQGEGGAPLRPDEETPDRLAAPVERIAPGWTDGFFTVPRLSALDERGEDDAFEDKARAEQSGRPEAEDADGSGA